MHDVLYVQKKMHMFMHIPLTEDPVGSPALQVLAGPDQDRVWWVSPGGGSRACGMSARMRCNWIGLGLTVGATREGHQVAPWHAPRFSSLSVGRACRTT